MDDSIINNHRIEKPKHLGLIKRSKGFVINCSTVIFNMEQIEFLRKYGHWLDALTKGEINPITGKQERFLKVMRGELNPFSFEERTWFIYQGRCKWEKENKEKLNLNYSLDGDDFYSRAHAKELRKQMFRTIGEIHRS